LVCIRSSVQIQQIHFPVMCDFKFMAPALWILISLASDGRHQQ
jgi:hypothetical protein